ncbi:AAA family ATPase [Pseudoxanthomonas kaohsiungensis]|uniref:AAA family ATPase n=1 Tax=Pseudoxanthomonas kaohsiungensis TaxID=283923 RepID=UPI0035B12F5A
MSAVLQESPKEAARRLAAGALQRGYRAEALHEYRDAEGNPVLWRIRCKHPDTGDKWIRPMHWTGTGYAIGEPDGQGAGRALYRLPELLADPAATVWIVEGEACADALAKAGKVATTSGSASSASGADWTPLQGRSVRLWPDHDEPGRKYADAVEPALRALGCTVERVDVAALGLIAGGDVVDWLGAGGGDLDALPLVAEPAVRLESGSGLPRVELLRGDSIMPEAVDWLWDGWLAAGKLQILGGQPGTGKTTIATALAATVTIGGRWPDGSRAEAGSVVIWSGEDDPADTLVPRLRAAGADMTRVHFIDGMRDGADRYPFDPARDSDSLLEALAGIGDVRLLVIDPIVSAVAGDSHKNAEVRRSLQPLVDLAQRQRCALLGVTHFTKGTAGREPVERITGSLAFGALARLVMVTAKAEAKDGEPARRFLARAKSNIGPDGGGFVYDLQQGELPGFPGVAASSVLWGAALEGTARELLADAEQQDDEAGEQRDAADWLRDVLGYGPMPVKDVKRQADECGFAWRSVQRAMRRAGVESRRGGFGQPATWRLASCATSGTVAPVAPNNLCGANGANGGVEDTDAGREVMEL